MSLNRARGTAAAAAAVRTEERRGFTCTLESRAACATDTARSLTKHTALRSNSSLNFRRMCPISHLTTTRNLYEGLLQTKGPLRMRISAGNSVGLQLMDTVDVLAIIVGA